CQSPSSPASSTSDRADRRRRISHARMLVQSGYFHSCMGSRTFMDAMIRRREASTTSGAKGPNPPPDPTRAKPSSGVPVSCSSLLMIDSVGPRGSAHCSSGEFVDEVAGGGDGYVEVDHRRLDVGVAHELLDVTDVGARLEEVGGVTVPEGVG